MKEKDRVVVVGPAGSGQLGQTGEVVSVAAARDVYPHVAAAEKPLRGKEAKAHRLLRGLPAGSQIVTVRTDDGRVRNFHESDLEVK